MTRNIIEQYTGNTVGSYAYIQELNGKFAAILGDPDYREHAVVLKVYGTLKGAQKRLTANGYSKA